MVTSGIAGHYDSVEALRTAQGAYLSAGVPHRDVYIEHKTDASPYINSGDKTPYTQTWAQYTLSQMPGCCGLVVSNHAFISSQYRGYGFGEYFHKERLKLMYDLGYSCGMATSTENNAQENRILEKNGWKKVHQFKNRRTNNTVFVWVKDLEKAA